MPDSLTGYAEWIELETFFSGYLLVYVIIYLVANRSVNNFTKTRVLPKLPLAYAFLGILYFGLQMKNAYPDYSIQHLTEGVQLPYLKIWGLLSIVCCIPFIRKKAVFSLLHSSVFFFLLLKSLYSQSSVSSGGNNIARNSMKIYTASILFSLTALILVVLVSLLVIYFKKQKRS